MNEFWRSANSDRFRKAGVYLLALGTVAAGILDLIWGEFDAAHQQIDALGDHLPGRTVFAYITAVWMISGGAAVLWRRTARAGALAIAIVYFMFAMFWLPRFYSGPHILGFRFTLFTGLLAQMCSQLIVVAGGLLLYASFEPPASFWPKASLVGARWTFGVGSALFGFGHLTRIDIVARMIPRWMPLGAPFWVVVTGIGFVLAGVAILSGVLNVLAARLLGLMLVIFELALIPLLFAGPHQHVVWGANAYNLAAAGAAWIFAASITERHAQSQREHDPKLYFAEASALRRD